MDVFDLLTCVVCQEKYDATKRVPKSLPCGHVTCSECLIKIMDSHLPKRCSECRQVFWAPEDALCDLPTCYPLLSIIAEVDKPVLIPSTAIKEREKGNEDKTTSTDISVENFHIGRCSKHVNSIRNFGCTTCQIWVCGTCAILDHNCTKEKTKGCKVLLAYKVLKELKLSLNKECEKALHIIKNLISANKDRDNLCLETPNSELLKITIPNNITNNPIFTDEVIKINASKIQNIQELLTKSISVEEIDEIAEIIDSLLRKLQQK